MTENYRTKRTSSSQFEIMVDFMEKYGDLSRPSEDSNGRITILHRWIELKDILNAEESGDTKSVVKWRKVWSDLKNNTKRKVAKSQTAWGNTSSKSILNDLEVRVLHVITSQGPSISEVVTEEASSEVITGQSIPIILDINHVQKMQTFENKKRKFEFVTDQPSSVSGEETSNGTDFRIKRKTSENEEELLSLRIQKEKLLIVKEEIAVRREEEIFKFEKEKHKLEILKLKLDIELLLDNNKLC